jgi:hypothetical protein
VGGLFEALELDSRGGHVFPGHDRDPFFALGSGALHARIAHGIARELQPDLADEQLMRFVMSRAIPIAPHCGFPAPLLWVRATEVERLDGIERRDDVPTPGRRRRVRR